MIIQLADKNDFNTLKKFLEDRDIKLNGIFHRSQAKNISFPAYYEVDPDFTYQSWSPIKDYLKGIEKYNSGIPVKAAINPEKYPEYYI